MISLDILPTALDAAGTRSLESAFDGRSLLPLLTGRADLTPRVLYWNSGEPKGEWAVRRGQWKAHGFKNRYQLYDLEADPSEKSDLADRHPETARELTELHTQWHAEMIKSAGGEGQSSNGPEKKKTKTRRERSRPRERPRD